MPRLLLIRHGQASFGKSNYDQLSDKGARQAFWLGEHFRDMADDPANLTTGTLKRHLQTAENIIEGMGNPCQQEQNPDWNEFEFERIAAAYLTQHPEERPEDAHKDPRQFFALLRKALTAWAHDQLSAPGLETWKTFEQRIQRALQTSTRNDERKTNLVVSSGGAISMAVGIVLELKPEAIIDLNLQTRNTGISELYYKKNKIYLNSFNAVPHLMQKDRSTLITSA